MQKSFLQKTWVVAGVAFLCSALWGSAFAGVKIGYELFQIASADWAAQMVFAGICRRCLQWLPASLRRGRQNAYFRPRQKTCFPFP